MLRPPRAMAGYAKAGRPFWGIVVVVPRCCVSVVAGASYAEVMVAGSADGDGGVLVCCGWGLVVVPVQHAEVMAARSADGGVLVMFSGILQ